LATTKEPRKGGKVKEKSVHYPGFIEYHPETGKYGGFLLDLPVFVAGRVSFDEAKKALEEGAKLYLAYLESEGKPVPEPGSNPTLYLDEDIEAQLTPVSISL
jgi:predicted RNase H-like HicB family nuclease